MEEKKFTMEELKQSTMLAEKARYKFTGCTYKVLCEELGEEKAQELLGKAYFAYGQLKHADAEVIPGDIAHFCDVYARGENPFFPYSMKMPYEVEGDHGKIEWCIENGCIGLDWFKEAGLTDREVCDLCKKCAVYGDIGYADKCGIEGYFTHTCADGSNGCEMILKKK